MLYLRPELQYAQYNRKLNDSYYKPLKLSSLFPWAIKFSPYSVLCGTKFALYIQSKSDLNLGDLKTNTTVGAHFGARSYLGLWNKL